MSSLINILTSHFHLKNKFKQMTQPRFASNCITQSRIFALDLKDVYVIFNKNILGRHDTSPALKHHWSVWRHLVGNTSTLTGRDGSQYIRESPSP